MQEVLLMERFVICGVLIFFRVGGGGCAKLNNWFWTEESLLNCVQEHELTLMTGTEEWALFL